ncbi:MAG: hypothetical protein GYB31_17440 [Bacteroidetes bacterium]|nr:hypothetical protein [Bacteroidota bacterium]
MRKLFLFSFVAVMALSVAGCKKNRILNQLAGDWEVTSFTEDGVELMGQSAYFTAFEIEYEDYEDTEGDFSWTLVDVYGDTYVVTGEYECNEAGDEVELTFQTGTVFNDDLVEFDFEVDKTSLTMKGSVDGFAYEIEADKD